MERYDTPKAEKQPKKLLIHNDERIDNYFWMRLSDEQKEAKKADQQTQNVIDYLNAENRYLKNKMQHTEELQENLFNEIKDRIKKDDSSVPVKIKDYSYYTRYEKDKEYPFYCRKSIETNSEEEIILNVPKMAKGYESTKTRITMTTSVANPATWIITLSLTAAQTSALDAPSRYVYDVEVTNNTSNVVTRVIEGIITVRPNVTI